MSVFMRKIQASHDEKKFPDERVGRKQHLCVSFVVWTGKKILCTIYFLFSTHCFVHAAHNVYMYDV